MSTGEVACFGANRVDAYLETFRNTSYRLLKRNILVSIGLYKAKQELLTAIHMLKELGYELYANIGTADFWVANNIRIYPIGWKYEQTETNLIGFENGNGELPTIENNSQTTSADYLANRLFDLVINIPMRSAVFSVPLMTNVKCVKLVFEALHQSSQQRTNFDMSIDCIGSTIIRLLGLID
ncbi:unnamed protein product [Rotaria sp. Silwood2]|nr:unnamed protein product [Rotaria sp. Silwood2]